LESLQDFAELDAQTLLSALGVERKRTGDWVLAATGALATGLVLGTAFGLFFAPATARKRREAFRRRVDKGP
jgi:hypothetical protein